MVRKIPKLVVGAADSGPVVYLAGFRPFLTSLRQCAEGTLGIIASPMEGFLAPAIAVFPSWRCWTLSLLTVPRKPGNVLPSVSKHSHPPY